MTVPRPYRPTWRRVTGTSIGNRERGNHVSAGRVLEHAGQVGRADHPIKRMQSTRIAATVEHVSNPSQEEAVPVAQLTPETLLQLAPAFARG